MKTIFKLIATIVLAGMTLSAAAQNIVIDNSTATEKEVAQNKNAVNEANLRNQQQVKESNAQIKKSKDAIAALQKNIDTNKQSIKTLKASIVKALKYSSQSKAAGVKTPGFFHLSLHMSLTPAMIAEPFIYSNALTSYLS